MRAAQWPLLATGPLESSLLQQLSSSIRIIIIMAIKSKIITSVEDGQKELPAKLLYPPYQTYFHSAQVAHNKQKLLSSLKQVGYDIAEYQDRPTSDILNMCEDKLKKTYSVKVVGIKDGELGVLSKRVEMIRIKPKKLLTKQGQTTPDPIFLLSQQPYQVHSTFQSKSLKTIKRVKNPQDEEYRMKLLNWQAQQFERVKGRSGAEDSGEETPDLENARRTKQLPHVKLQKMRKTDSPKMFDVERHGEVTEVHAILKPPMQSKMSYSRILEHFAEKDGSAQPMKNQLVVVNLHKKAPEPPRLGEAIVELDEEHENIGSDQKKPGEEAGVKQVSQFSIPFSETDGLQRRLKKIQEKFNSEHDTLF